MSSFQLPADALEYVVLTKLWELGTASVRDVHGVLGKPEGLVYTTIAKVIDRLHGKGLIQRERPSRRWLTRWMRSIQSCSMSWNGPWLHTGDRSVERESLLATLIVLLGG